MDKAKFMQGCQKEAKLLFADNGQEGGYGLTEDGQYHVAVWQPVGEGGGIIGFFAGTGPQDNIVYSSGRVRVMLDLHDRIGVIPNKLYRDRVGDLTVQETTKGNIIPTALGDLAIVPEPNTGEGS